MGRKEERLRQEGMSFCGRYLTSHGMDAQALMDEIKRRGAYGIPLRIDEATEREFEERVMHSCMDTVLAMTCVVLHDEFGFGHDRLARFVERFNSKTASLAEGYTTWDEQLKILADECKVYLDIRFNGEAGEEVIHAS